MILQILFVLAASGFTLTAAVSDLKTRKLPNWLTVPAFVVAVVAHTAVGGLGGLGFSLLGFATGFGLLLILWLIGGSGGGDVKMMGALGAWLGARLTLQVFVVSAALLVVLCAGVLLLALATRGFGYVWRNYSTAGNSGRTSGERLRTSRFRIVPYAVPVALSTWLVLTLAWATSGLPM